MKNATQLNTSAMAGSTLNWNFVKKAASHNVIKEEQQSKTNNFTTKSENTKSMSITFIPKVESYDET